MNFVKLSHYVIGSGTLALVSLGIVNASEAATLGGQLFSTGGDVSVKVLPSEARYTSTLFLLDPNQGGVKRDLVTNRDIGTVVNLGSFASGVELMFGIQVHVPKKHGHDNHNMDNHNMDKIFMIGPSWRNPDNVAHAMVDSLGTGVFNVGIEANVGFEDKFGGGDLDYNDNVFQFRGKIAQDPPTPKSVPEPGMLVGVMAIGLGAFFKRKLSQKT
ncbi:MAG: PEP-CTERM sorting domain-containing protein [Microcystaceae cyanobacterium]